MASKGKRGRPKGSKNKPKEVVIEGKKVTKARINKLNKMASTVNRRLAALEKAGLELDSVEYQMISYYAIDKNSKNYDVNLEKGTIRATKDLSRFETRKELSDYQSILKNILDAQTSTVRGTKAAINKSVKKINEKLALRKDSFKKDIREMDYDRYKQIWRIYRNTVKDRNKQKTESDTIFNIMAREEGFYDLTDAELKTAFKYANNSKIRGGVLEDKIYKKFQKKFDEYDDSDYELL